MESNYSLANLKKFLDTLEGKGLVNANTARGYKAACSKILTDLSAQEEADVRKVDVGLAIRRFNNKHPGMLSPRSLSEYQRRLSTVIRYFVQYTENPAGFKPASRAPGKSQDAGKEKKSTGRKRASPKGTAVAPAPSAAPGDSLTPQPTAGLPLSFPLRADFLAQVVVPRDLKADEARRLSAFIMTLAGDYTPGG